MIIKDLKKENNLNMVSEHEIFIYEGRLGSMDQVPVVTNQQ